MLRKSLLAVLFLISTGAFAHGECTAEEAQAKHQEFMNKVIELAQKDQQKYQDIAQAMQSQLPELQKINDLEGLCKFYDEWSKKME